MSLVDLAAKMGIDHAALSRKERGLKGFRIKPPERARFAAALGLSLDEFDIKWRSSAIPQSRVHVGIPVINRAPAGRMIEMDECGTDSGQGYQFLDRTERTQADLLFAIVVTGNSMEPSLFEGDYIVFHPLGRDRPINGQPVLKDGTLVYAKTSPGTKHPGCTVARYYAQGDEIRLQKDNLKYAPIVVSKNDVEQMSVAIEIRHNRLIYK